MPSGLHVFILQINVTSARGLSVTVTSARWLSVTMYVELEVLLKDESGCVGSHDVFNVVAS